MAGTLLNEVMFSDPWGLCKPWPECWFQGAADWGARRGGTFGTVVLNAAAAANGLSEALDVNTLGAAVGEGDVVGAGIALAGMLPVGKVAKAGRALEVAADAVRAIPGNPFRGANAAQEAYRHLERYSGLDPQVASNRLHRLKEAGGLGAADDVAIGRTGDVYNAATGERLGTLTDPGLGGAKR